MAITVQNLAGFTVNGYGG